MNFNDLIPFIISVYINFIFVFMILTIIKFYFNDLFISFGQKKLTTKLFLKLENLSNNLDFKDKVEVINSISIGNEINNDIILNSDYNNSVKLVISLDGNKIYAENFNNTNNIKVNGIPFLGKIILRGDEEILILDTLFKLSNEVI